MARHMTFKRYGRSYHLRIDSAEQLAQAVELDPAHWVATAAPTDTINCDLTLIDLLDVDRSGRLTCDEVAAGIRWLLAALADTSGVDAHSTTLELAAVNTDTDDGRRIHEAATKMLARSGEPDRSAINLDEVRKIKAQVEATPVSEAGVVLPEAADDPDIRRFLADIVAATGGAPHPSGIDGVAAEQLDEFIAAGRDYLAWYRQGQVGDRQTTDICPLGDATAAAYAALEAVRPRVDLFFAQCEAAALDERLVQRMGWTEAELKDLDLDNAEAIERVLREAPLAPASGERILRFGDQVNPYDAERIERFRRLAVEPAVGIDLEAMTAAQWQQVKSFFEDHRAWAATIRGEQVAGLGVGRLQEYQDERFARAVNELIAASAETTFVLENIRLTEKLILCQSRMIDLANNFVSFPHLYDPGRRAMFETGTLIMDGRRFTLAVEAADPKAHAAVAGTGSMFLLYVEVDPAAEQAKYHVAVPVTSGGKGNLCVGKRGVFFDLDGAKHAARVVHIVENPISLREAMVAPFKRLGRLFTGKIESLTTAAQKKLDTQATAAIDKTAGTPAPAGQSQALARGGMLVGAGVAVAALGSALAYIVNTLKQMFYGAGFWTYVCSILAAVGVVVLPTTILAFIKLRRRDLSAILEGSGWAINARMRLTRGQSLFFTQRPDYPAGSRGIRRPGLWALVALAVIAAMAAAGYSVALWLF